MMETVETDEADGQSSGHRGLQAQVVIRFVHVWVLLASCLFLSAR